MAGKKFRQFLVVPALMLAAMLTGCVDRQSRPHGNDPLLRVMQICGGGYTEDWSPKIVIEYNKLTAKGEIGITAARKAGVIIYDSFKDKPENFKEYLKCIDKNAMPYLTADSRPRVAIVGSNEDYTNYNLQELAATSADLLDNDLRLAFQTKAIIVTYGMDHEEELREFKPAVVVIHASAFSAVGIEDKAVSKFQAYIRSLYTMPSTKFVVFSRLPPPAPPPELCKRWNQQVAFLTSSQRQDRLFFYPLERSESNFTGKAGIEIRQIVRCQSGMEPERPCNDEMAGLKKEAKKMIRSNTCQPS